MYHIIGMHASRDAEVRAKIEPQARFAVEHPRFVINDIQSPGRVKYLNLADIQDDTKTSIRTIAVVVDKDEVITWFARRTINNVLEKGDVIYDERNNNLPV